MERKGQTVTRRSAQCATSHFGSKIPRVREGGNSMELYSVKPWNLKTIDFTAIGKLRSAGESLNRKLEQRSREGNGQEWETKSQRGAGP